MTFREEMFNIEPKQQMLHYYDYKMGGLCCSVEDKMHATRLNFESQKEGDS